MSDAKYETKIVTWLDILGFKDVTPKSNNSESKYTVNGIKEIFNEINQVITDYMDTAGVFSDSILIVSHPKFESNLYNCIKKIHILLLEEDILLRGAMVKGDVYATINKSGYLEAFGPAMNRAIELEKQATYPRVVIDDSILGLSFSTIPDGKTFTIKEYFNGFGLIEDFDGLYFVDYLTEIRCIADKAKREDLINKFEILIERESNHVDINISKKYKWLRTHWAKVKIKNISV
jgi:hypothetical protein